MKFSFQIANRFTLLGMFAVLVGAAFVIRARSRRPRRRPRQSCAAGASSSRSRRERAQWRGTRAKR